MRPRVKAKANANAASATAAVTLALALATATGGALAALAACSSEAAGSGAAGGDPAAAAPSTAPTHKAPPPDTQDDASSGSTPVDPTNDPHAPACTGAPGTLYAITPTSLAGASVPLCRFKGNVLLVVNTASHCGYTPQYAPLESQYEKYRPQGFYVLGFPSGSFNQEFADAGDVSTFCTTEYHITFPMFSIANVNAPDEEPVYTWLKAQWHPTHTDQPEDVQWNFEKYLVGRDGKVVARFMTATTPDDPSVTAAIEAELAKPAP